MFVGTVATLQSKAATGLYLSKTSGSMTMMTIFTTSLMSSTNLDLSSWESFSRCDPEKAKSQIPTGLTTSYQAVI